MWLKINIVNNEDANLLFFKYLTSLQPARVVKHPGMKSRRSLTGACTAPAWWPNAHTSSNIRISIYLTTGLWHVYFATCTCANFVFSHSDIYTIIDTGEYCDCEAAVVVVTLSTVSVHRWSSIMHVTSLSAPAIRDGVSGWSPEERGRQRGDRPPWHTEKYLETLITRIAVDIYNCI